jgi:hypothetical protein
MQIKRIQSKTDAVIIAAWLMRQVHAAPECFGQTVRNGP